MGNTAARARVALVLVIGIFCTCFCAAEAQGSVDVTGTVVAGDGNPIPNATVILSSAALHEEHAERRAR